MSFHWSRAFESGIELVDRQHRSLVELINQALPFLDTPDLVDPAQRRYLLDRLLAEAEQHFQAETGLMRQHGVDQRHAAPHQAAHQAFIAQLQALRDPAGAGLAAGQGPGLLALLIDWLSGHVLAVDRRLALQIHDIDAGQPAATAYERALAQPVEEQARQALVAALVDVHTAFDERREAMDRAHLLVSFDQLTGLPNRSHFLGALNRLVELALTELNGVALMLLDVDDLSAINRNHGHEVADKVLGIVSSRLREVCRQQDMVARTGDDEFALVLLGGRDVAGLQEAAERLYQQVRQPLAIDGHALAFSLSAGVALLPADAGDAEHLLAAAEIAQAAAKRQGGGLCCRFDPVQGQPGFARVEAVQSLRNAIAGGELVLHYQPQVSLHSGQIVGLEALVRWRHPTRGMVPPGQFIPLAEETGLVIPLGEWVIRTALAQIAAWRDAAVPVLRVAVNLSARHYLQPGLPQLVAAALDEYAIAPHLLELELTESVMMQDAALAIAISEQLKALGVRLSLDDFGTGYSSLAYLSRFSIDILKIDQSFIRDITTNPVNASISVATIAMAHKLGKSVIAEGVETEGQMAYLRRHDCDEMQGYFFSRPLPAEEISELLRRGAALNFGDQSLENQPCLLLVDDEANILSALKRLLRREGYRILTADSAALGLDLLASNHVQVILSDQRMPEMTGTEFLSRVKELYPHTVRMVLSGYSELASVTEAINRGAIYKYLSKPWHDEELKQEVRLAFRHQRERSEGAG